MRSWLPVPGTTTGRLVEAALALFGARGFDAVGVGDLAAAAGVTTGSIYHHFGSKAGLWNLVRADVEQRVVDRIEGAAAVSPVRDVADLAPALLTSFDYVERAGFAALIADATPRGEGSGEPLVDPIEATIDRLLAGSGEPVGHLVVAAWRAALERTAAGADAAASARAALARLLS